MALFDDERCLRGISFPKILQVEVSVRASGVEKEESKCRFSVIEEAIPQTIFIQVLPLSLSLSPLHPLFFSPSLTPSFCVYKLLMSDCLCRRLANQQKKAKANVAEIECLLLRME